MRTEHQLAFADWYSRHIDRLSKLWDRPDYSHRDIKLTLRAFAPHLVARITRENATVAIEWEHEEWDYPFAADVQIGRGPLGGWICQLNSTPDDGEPLIRSALWEQYLFEPLAEYVERVVAPSVVLYLCGRRYERWARLSFDASDPPQAAIYAVFNNEERA